MRIPTKLYLALTGPQQARSRVFILIFMMSPVVVPQKINWSSSEICVMIKRSQHEVKVSSLSSSAKLEPLASIRLLVTPLSKCTSRHFTILFSLPVWQSVGLIFLLTTSSSQTLRVPLQPKQSQETEALDADLAGRKDDESEVLQTDLGLKSTF